MKNDMWFKWYPAKYKADTMHLTAEQDGIYRRLIDHYMETSQPLPDNLVALSRIAGISGDILEGNWPVLAVFFRTEGNKLHLKVCDELVRERAEKSEKFRQFGKMGGRPKVSGENPRVSESIPEAKPDKRREDKIRDLSNDKCIGVNSSSKDEQNGKTKRPKSDKGSRLDDWLKANGPANGALPSDWIDWIDAKYQWNDGTIGHIAGQFYRYFTGPDAKEPVKKDWKRAFQTWCDRSIGEAQAFIRANSGTAQSQGKGYSSAVNNSSEQARNLMESQSGDNDDAPDFQGRDTDGKATSLD